MECYKSAASNSMAEFLSKRLKRTLAYFSVGLKRLTGGEILFNPSALLSKKINNQINECFDEVDRAYGPGFDAEKFYAAASAALIRGAMAGYDIFDMIELMCLFASKGLFVESIDLDVDRIGTQMGDMVN